MGAWLLYASDTPKKRLIYLASAFVLGVGGYFLISSVKKTLSSWTRENPSAALEPYVGGAIEEIRIDDQKATDFSKICSIPGQVIMLSGWIQSRVESNHVPVVKISNPSNEIVFNVTKVSRPDVVLHENDPDLMESGFTASVKIPMGQFPGEYSISAVNSGKGAAQSYFPYINIKIFKPVGETENRRLDIKKDSKTKSNKQKN